MKRPEEKDFRGTEGQLLKMLFICAQDEYINHLESMLKSKEITNWVGNIPEKENKPTLTIGVITPTFIQHRNWVDTIGGKKYPDNNVIFHHIRNMETVLGRVYFAIEKGYDWQNVSKSVYDYALTRIHIQK